ncbi:DUF2235 domain-containing protein [Rhizorhabdus histidinilytica]|uniref:DUF2235 domain-containing protein n=1 Tax=Rhizorhabdus histidinilytica TaxID=439228 RepID=UPI0032205E0D
MAKNILIFSDGTGQEGGIRAEQRLSNIYKLYRATRVGPENAIDPSEQIAFYDPGLGTEDDAHGVGKIWRSVVKTLASVAGRGIAINIIDCYEFLINHWEPGDRIYIFGFSRGAYTARCIAQVISLCGVPSHEAGEPQKPFKRFAQSTHAAARRAVHQVYEHGAGHPIADFEAERDEQARRFRADYGSDDNGIANANPYFIGVFDTVAALGVKGWKYWALLGLLTLGAAIAVMFVSGLLSLLFGLSFWPLLLVLGLVTGTAVSVATYRNSVRFIDDFPNKGSPRHTHRIRWRASNYDRGLSRHVGFARHASSIDEDRADFPRVGWGNADVVRKPIEGEPLPLVQLYFAGNHSDIGGSYPEVESRLSDISLQWMVDEITTLPHPVAIDRSRLNLWPDHNGLQHSEVYALRDKLKWLPRWAPKWLRSGWPEAERKPRGFPVHPSVFARFSAQSVPQISGNGPYRPTCLREDARFAAFYDDKYPETAKVIEAFKGSSFRIAIEPYIEISVGDDARVRELLERQGISSAGLFQLNPWLDDGSDEYRDALQQRYFEVELARRGLSGVAAQRHQGGEPLFFNPCILVEGISEAQSKELARFLGQPVYGYLSAETGFVIHEIFRKD